MNFEAVNNIFSTDTASFDERCLELFAFQFRHNQVYQEWCRMLRKDPSNVISIDDIPFLPISFFKTHEVRCTDFDAALVFESSGTTGQSTSRHFVKDPSLYNKSFLECFHQFFGNPEQYCILALLPSYLERRNSSLVYMVEELNRKSGHPLGGFFLYEHSELADRITQLELQQQPAILFGVTYALLDFAENHSMSLAHTIVIETGGMKGRKKEITRQEVHSILRRQFGLPAVHSEYGMTELLSQAYSLAEGRFQCPPWMRIFVRSEDDPMEVAREGRGVINVVDLANVYSCAFIATDDAGILESDGMFEVLGRIDNSDVRGCSLLAL